MNVAGRCVRLAPTAGLGAVLLAAILIEGYAVAHSWGASHWIAGGAAATAAGLLALGRHRHLTGTAVAGLAVAAAATVAARSAHLPAEPGPALALAVAVLVGSAVRALPPVRASAIAAAGLAVAAGAVAAARPSSGAGAVAVMNLVAWFAALTCGLARRTLDHRAETTAERVRQDERLELARELHDVVAHHLTGILLQAQAAQIVARRDPENATSALARIEAASSDALAATRRTVGLLRDPQGDAAPAGPEPERLDDLVGRFARQGRPVHLELPDGHTAWPLEVSTTVHRIVQESLTNVARHAPQARSVTVTVTEGPDGIGVEVADDAPPAPARARPRGGYGLVGMRERVERLGGAFEAGPQPGGGWSVRATLPAPARRPG